MSFEKRIALLEMCIDLFIIERKKSAPSSPFFLSLYIHILQEPNMTQQDKSQKKGGTTPPLGCGGVATLRDNSDTIVDKRTHRSSSSREYHNEEEEESSSIQHNVLFLTRAFSDAR